MDIPHDSNEYIAAHVYVSGYVQGVFFRSFTLRQARVLHIYGYVRNCMDGRVEVWAEGPRAAVQRFIVWLHQGSPYSRVDDVAVAWCPYEKKYESFDVK